MKRIASMLLVCACFHENNTIPDETSSGSSSTSTSSISTSTSTSGADDSSTEMESGSASGTSTTMADPDTSSSTGPEPVIDWALYFDGTASMQSTEALDLDLGNDFTVEAWLRIDSADAHGPIVSYRGVGTSGWLLALDVQSRLVFGFYDNNGAWHEVVGADAGDLDPGWHHVAGTKDGASLYLHVDGVAATSPCAMVASSPTVPLIVGTDDADDFLVTIAADDIRLSNIARYQAAFDPPVEFDVDPSTAILLLLDESDGTAAFDEVSSIGFVLQGVTWTPGNTAS